MSTLESSSVLETFEHDIASTERRVSLLEARLENIKGVKRRERMENTIQEARTEIANLLAKTVQIKAVSDPLKQKEDYTAELWNERFIRLGDIEALDGLFPEGEKLRMLIWSRLPDCRFKRVQELFCKPEDFAVPHFEVVDKRIVFPAGFPFHDLPLDPILIDINLVPDNLLEKLKIVEFPDEDPVEHLERKVKAMPQFKEIFERATQLSPRNKRILVIASRHNQRASIEADVVGAPNEVEGALLYTKTDDRKKSATAKNQFERRSVQFFPNAYSAHRKTKHEELAYSNEIGKLAKIIVKIGHLNQELNERWKSDTHITEKQEMRERANELFTECAETLKYCSNLFKVRASSRVQTILSHVSSEVTQKPNISAVMTCMTSARNDLNLRNSKDIESKSGFNQQDRSGLRNAISSHESTIEEYGDGIKEIARRFDSKLEIFEPGRVTSDNVMKKVEGFLVPVRTELLETVSLAPFVTYAARLHEKYDQLSGAVSLQDKEAAAAVLIQMHVIKKFLDVQRVFEKIKEVVIDPRYVSIDVVRRFITNLNLEFSTFQIFPDMIVENYVPAYEAMRSKLGIIERQLQHYETMHHMSIEECTEMYGRLKEYLDTFNIPEIVKNLA